MTSVFDWKQDTGPKQTYPQLEYYHRKMAEGTHPRQLRRKKLPVVDQRFKQRDYQEKVMRLFVKPRDKKLRLVHAAMGIAGEAGEVVDAVKKHWVYGKPLDTENVLEECGDILFYVAATLDLCGFTLDDAMTHNMEKLAKRYPLGVYSDKAAIERADKK